ncbi:MAG: DoxX family protein [Gammaproteobacteria bacterium]|nr:DoxX family protein [Gammaproteobacteria bacterium]
MDDFLSAWSSRVLSILRIVTAFLFMAHGTQKVFGFPGSQRQEFDLFSLSGVAGTLEVFGGLLILFGLFTRPVAFLLSGQMAFAYFIAHAPRDFWPLLNGGELAAMWSFLFLYLAFAGGGEWSLDHIRNASRTGKPT